jgi:hypothetical protein
MIGATRGRPVEDFPGPKGTVTRPYARRRAALATEACPNVTTERFPDGSEPTELCTAHPGPPLREPEAGERAPDVRDLDRRDTEREVIHIH